MIDNITCNKSRSTTRLTGVSNDILTADKIVTSIIIQSRYVIRPRNLLKYKYDKIENMSSYESETVIMAALP